MTEHRCAPGSCGKGRGGHLVAVDGAEVGIG